LSVLVHEATEEITSVDSGRLVHAGERQSDDWIRRLQTERPVRAVALGFPARQPCRANVTDLRGLVLGGNPAGTRSARQATVGGCASIQPGTPG
jgi:hypothetical protein